MQKVLRKRYLFSKRIFLILVISLNALFIAVLQKPVYASPKSLYVIADIRPPLRTVPVRVYEIRATLPYLLYQTTQYAPLHGSGAIGLAIDSESQTMFITYENTNVIQIINATTFAVLGTIIATEASNLAGIAYDSSKNLLYTVNRWTGNLLIYRWNFTSRELILEKHVMLTNSSRAYGIAIDDIKGILYVADGEYSKKFDWYDTDTWMHLGTKVTNHAVIGIAVDAHNGFIYTGGAWYDYGLYRYDMNTDTEIGILNDTSSVYAGVLGIATDLSQNSSPVYITTFGEGTIGYRDVLAVFDFNLNLLWKSEDLGNPTGIAIPKGEITYASPSSNTFDYLPWIIFGIVGFIILSMHHVLKYKKHK
jgi:DNA-binding beta-propeller fold protein YncE